MAPGIFFDTQCCKLYEILLSVTLRQPKFST